MADDPHAKGAERSRAETECVLTRKVQFSLAFGAVLFVIAGVVTHPAIHALRMHSMPHHWYALSYTTIRHGGYRSQWVEQYLDGAVGPFPDKTACVARLKNLPSFLCIDSVDADVRPRQGYAEKP